MTMPSCDVISRDVGLVGGGRGHQRVCCCPRWFVARPPESADSAALYEYTYAQRTVAGGDTTTMTADKRLRPSPRSLVRDRGPLPPLLPPPPPPTIRADLSEDLAWTRLGGIEHEVFVERCPHAAVYCPSSSARHLLVPPPRPTRSQLTTTRDETTTTSKTSSTPTELQLCRVDNQQDCDGTVS